MRKEYLCLERIEGPLMMLSGVSGGSYGEALDIRLENGEHRTGRVIRIEEDIIIAQVSEGTSGMSTRNACVRFTGKPMEIYLSKEIMGRTFDGVGRPIDGGGEIYNGRPYNINGRPINPVARRYPEDFIQTGISAIDCFATLIRGQKLPIFSASGLPHNQLAAQLVKQATISGDSADRFAIVFAAIGVRHEDAEYFRLSFEEAGVLERVVMYINLAGQPVAERISTPRCALTAAEYLAFEEGMHILVILTDVTNYCEALRQISNAREEVPGRKGYPGYLYSDLASLYERAGMIKGRDGSITLLPILTMPGDDITHPIPDLTGFITEGQIVLDRELFQRDIYPPVGILPSLSRLMKDGIGEGFTREDHPEVANQLFASYSRARDIRALAGIIGEEDLSPVDKKYMEFARVLEKTLIAQQPDQNRSITETLDLAWQVLFILPESELDRLSPGMLKKFYKG